jgi:hypothetical protein
MSFIQSPELETLYRRYQRYERLANHYQAIVQGMGSVELTVNPEAGTVTFHTTAFQRIPKSIPRGRPAHWYLKQCQYYTAKASDTSDFYWSLKDAEQKRAWDRLDREGKLAELHEIGQRLVRTEELIQEWRAKIPAWERECAERKLPETVEEQVEAWIARFGNPYPMIHTLELGKREDEANRDWLLERL